MITYKRAKLTQEEINQLINLSQMWVDEDCSFGMVTNTKDDIHNPLYLAYDKERIVGYIMGEFFVEDRKRSYIEIGEKCFEVQEIYVLPSYRNKGIGKKLYSLLENEVKDKVKYIVLATTTKDYKKALKFYTEDNDMVYHSSFLIKKTK